MAREMLEKDIELSNGLQMHYHEWPGEGPTLILLHPSAGFGRMWGWVADELGDKFHIYAPDQRGHGRTGRPDGDYSAEEYAGDVDLFMEALGIERAVIGGHSLGGRVTQAFGGLYPNRCSALILVASPHASNFYGTAESALAIMKGSYEFLLQPQTWASREELMDFMAVTHPMVQDEMPGRNLRADHNYVIGEDGSYTPRYDPVRVAEGLMHQTADMRGHAAATECPVLMVRGLRGFLPRDQADAIAGFWKNAEVVDIDGVYAIQLDNPAGVARSIVDFLRKHAIV